MPTTPGLLHPNLALFNKYLTSLIEFKCTHVRSTLYLGRGKRKANPTVHDSSIDLTEGETTTPWLQNWNDNESSSAIRTQWTSTSKIKHQQLVCILAALVIFGLGIVTGICGTMYRHNKPLSVSETAPDLTIYNDTPFPYYPHRFNGSFFKLSEYVGKPNEHLDAAWSRWTQTGNDRMPAYPALMRISRSDFEKTSAHHIDTAVQFDDAMDQNEGYMASFEMLHQIHCLDMIRKFVHWDYYEEHDPDWANAPLLREHSDHCLSILLEVLWCRGDTGLVTYHWVKGKDDTPVPDFSTLHSCRDPAAILKYAKEHEYAPSHKMVRPEGHPVIEEMF